LEGDRDLLVRVLVNLLDNAILHNKGNHAIEVSAETESDGVRIDVKDRGPGVPEEFRLRIFEEYFRLNAGGPRSTGLGLTYCKLVTEAHGGRIWVTPRDKGGSCFSVYLPLNRPDSA
jgi:signal transduction histidine kinase